jgi:hypothetical protein
VIYDDLHCGPEDIQKLTYKLSYIYYNYSGAVKIPSPLRYAKSISRYPALSNHMKKIISMKKKTFRKQSNLLLLKDHIGILLTPGQI